MFTRNDANHLREQLLTLDFQTPVVENELVANYKSHYGLEFGGLPALWHMGTFQSGDYTLVCQYYAVPESERKGCAFLLHGYYDHAGLFGHLTRHCLQMGYDVIIFDMPGHGLSDGEVAGIDSFQDYSTALLECCRLAQHTVAGPWQLIGQSTGGATILDGLLHNELDQQYSFANIVLLCPLLYALNWRRSTPLFYLLRMFVKSITREFANNSHDKNFLEFLKNTDELQSQRLQVSWVAAMIDYQKRFKRADNSEVPIHIIQGTGDETVDWNYNLRLIENKFPQMTSHLIPDAKHHLVNESAEYRSQIFSTISEIVY